MMNRYIVRGRAAAGRARAATGRHLGLSGDDSVFVLTGLVVLWPMTPDNTRNNARREDYRPHVEELLVVAAAPGGLVGIVVLLVLGNTTTGSPPRRSVWPASSWPGRCCT
jgi:hypothetical protein